MRIINTELNQNFHELLRIHLHQEVDYQLDWAVSDKLEGRFTGAIMELESETEFLLDNQLLGSSQRPYFFFNFDKKT